MKRTYFLLLIMMIFSASMFAQVGINTEAPNSLTELDIQNLSDKGVKVPKGIMIPQMNEAERNQIDVTDPNKANSLMIYNTDEDCYNYYSKTDKEWKSLCGSLGKMTSTIDCSDITVMGSYVIGSELAVGNKLKIKLVVEKPGSYDIAGVTTNGYSFSASGVILNKGIYTIYAQGAGTPIIPQTDEVKLSNNGQTIACATPIKIEVVQAVGSFTMNCTSTKVRGVYKVGQQTNVTHRIEFAVNVSKIGSWSIESDEVDGISFSGNGVFTKVGSNTITAYCQGIPRNNSIKEFKLKSNSAGGSATLCTAKVFTVLPSKRILSLGSSGWAVHAGTAGLAKMFNSPYNFGNREESIVKSELPIFATTSYINGSITKAKIGNYINIFSPDLVDIIFIAYNADLQADVIDDMVNYVKMGGVVIMLNEHTNEQPGNINFLKTLFDDNAISANDNLTLGGGGMVFKLPNIDNPILNGPFGRIGGGYIGEDNGYHDVLTYLPASEVEWSVNCMDYSGATIGDGSRIFAFKAKNYPLFWCGDGGLASGTGFDTSSTSKPFSLNNTTEVIPNKRLYGRGTKREISNSIMIANMLAWALQYAEDNGIKNLLSR